MEEPLAVRLCFADGAGLQLPDDSTETGTVIPPTVAVIGILGCPDDVEHAGALVDADRSSVDRDHDVTSCAVVRPATAKLIEPEHVVVLLEGPRLAVRHNWTIWTW